MPQAPGSPPLFRMSHNHRYNRGRGPGGGFHLGVILGGLDDEVSEPLERTRYVDQVGALPGLGLQDAPKRYNDSAQGIQAVRQGEIDILFVLTADYLESGWVEQYGTSPEGGRRFSGNPDAESAFNDFLRVELIAGRVEADTLARVANPVTTGVFT